MAIFTIQVIKTETLSSWNLWPWPYKYFTASRLHFGKKKSENPHQNRNNNHQTPPFRWQVLNLNLASEVLASLLRDPCGTADFAEFEYLRFIGHVGCWWFHEKISIWDVLLNCWD